MAPIEAPLPPVIPEQAALDARVSLLAYEPFIIRLVENALVAGGLIQRAQDLALSVNASSGEAYSVHIGNAMLMGNPSNEEITDIVNLLDYMARPDAEQNAGFNLNQIRINNPVMVSLLEGDLDKFPTLRNLLFQASSGQTYDQLERANRNPPDSSPMKVAVKMASALYLLNVVTQKCDQVSDEWIELIYLALVVKPALEGKGQDLKETIDRLEERLRYLKKGACFRPSFEGFLMSSICTALGFALAECCINICCLCPPGPCANGILGTMSAIFCAIGCYFAEDVKRHEIKKLTKEINRYGAIFQGIEATLTPQQYQVFNTAINNRLQTIQPQDGINDRVLPEYMSLLDNNGRLKLIFDLMVYNLTNKLATNAREIAALNAKREQQQNVQDKSPTLETHSYSKPVSRSMEEESPRPGSKSSSPPPAYTPPETPSPSDSPKLSGKQPLLSNRTK